MNKFPTFSAATAHQHKMRRVDRGFSLIELMIAVVIVSILAAIAMPSYQAYVMRSNRTAAKSILTDIVSRQESYRADRKAFATTLAALGYSDPTFVSRDGSHSATEGTESIYSVSISGTATAFTLSAAPRKSQLSDTDCATLTLTSAGLRSTTGTSSDCWSR